MPRLQLTFECAPSKLEAGRIADAINATDVAIDANFTATVRFVPPSEMAILTSRFKDSTAPTNVLTFVHGNGADIAVCPQVAVADAKIRGWDVCSELVFLCVHGCLHALGFDHEDEAGKNEMERHERLILSRIGIDAHALR